MSLDTLSKMATPIRLLNVFGGAGGLALGFEQGGFSVAAALEPDPVHAATFKRNFPTAEVVCAPVCIGSVARLADPSGFHVVAGSLPSSAFSVGGRRDPEDDRRELLDRFVEVVIAVGPQAYALEAVPGILSNANTGFLHRALRKLAGAGYGTPQIWTLEAAEFGVPQTRSRVWVIGTADSVKPPSMPRPEVVPVHRRPAGITVLPRNGLPVGPTVWDAIGDLPDPGEYAELRTSDRIRKPTDLPDPSKWAAALATSEPIGFSAPRRVDPSLLTASQATVHRTSSVWRFAETAPGTAEPVSRFFRLHAGGLARTLRAGTGRDRGSFTGSRPIHPSQPRVVTVREGARLQGFPDWFGFNATKWHGFHQVGASAPPPVARAVADRLRDTLQVAPNRPAGASLTPDDTLLFLDLTRAGRLMGAEVLPAPRRRGLRSRPRLIQSESEEWLQLSLLPGRDFRR